MNVSAPFIVRPIATTLLMIGVTLLGSSPISFRRSWGCPRSTSRYSGVGEPAGLGCLPPSQDGLLFNLLNAEAALISRGRSGRDPPPSREFAAACRRASP